MATLPPLPSSYLGFIKKVIIVLGEERVYLSPASYFEGDGTGEGPDRARGGFETYLVLCGIYSCRRLQLVSFFQQKGASLEIKDNDGNTPLSLALREDHHG